MKSITFIHAADLHLDSPMIGLKTLPHAIFKRLQESTFQALKKLVDTAIVNNVDFVIIAGDLYDEEDRSVRAQIRFRNEMNRLAQCGIPVYIVHGNHDHLSGTRFNMEMPNNVHIFAEKVEMKSFEKANIFVHLYGFSYPTRHVHDKMIDQYKIMGGADYHIGILHGNIEGNYEHGQYAPFHLNDLLKKDFNYWALGHIHKRAILNENPTIVYPGNIQGRNKKETGEKGFYLVQLNQKEVELQFIESSDIIWKKLVVDASNVSKFDEIYLLCKKVVEENRDNKCGVLMTLNLTNIDIEFEGHKSIYNGELLEVLQDEEKEEENFVWLVELSVSENVNWNKEKLKMDSDFYSELFQTTKELSDIENSLAPLYQHPLANRYLSALSEKDKQDLLMDAENLLVQSLIYKETKR